MVSFAKSWQPITGTMNKLQISYTTIAGKRFSTRITSSCTRGTLLPNLQDPGLWQPKVRIHRRRCYGRGRRSHIEPDTCPWEPSIRSSPKCAPTHWLTPATEIPGNETACLDDMDVHQCLDFISREDQEEEMVEMNIYEIIFQVVYNSLAIRWILFCFTKWIKRLKKMYTNKMHHKKRKRRCTCKLESKGPTLWPSSWGKVLQDMWARS
uniref:uncharacterized protein n=1 Tax=Myxine glutinosa TaxID=7769 RepID=UPI00358EDBB1